jgi:hypothetical protein
MQDPSHAIPRLPSAEERALFLKRFARFGSAPSVESYLALFHPEARLFDDGMERPIGVSEIPAHIEGVLALVRGFRMRPERWRARGATLFVEAHNGGEVAGSPVSWRAVYRIELEGAQVRDGRRYFDRGALVARLDPAAPTRAGVLAPRGEPRPPEGAVAGSATTPEQVVAELARCWQEGRPQAIAALFREDASLVAPGVARPLGAGEVAGHLERLARLLGRTRLAPRSWAGDDSLLFVEWEAAVPAPEGGSPIGIVDRLDLVEGRVLAARSYFDSSALARAAAAAAG